MYVRPSSVIKGLTNAGYQVHVDHLRWISVPLATEAGIVVGPMTRGEMHIEDIPGELIDPRGGETIVTVTSPDRMQIWCAKSVCSLKDNFCRTTGLGIALERIFSGAGIKVHEAQEEGLTFTQDVGT